MMKRSRCNCCKFLPYPFIPGRLFLGIGREVASVHWYFFGTFLGVHLLFSLKAQRLDLVRFCIPFKQGTQGYFE